MSSKMNKTSLSGQRKKLAVCVADDKIQDFKLNIRALGKPYHRELDSFSIFKGFSDEISGNIKNFDFGDAWVA